MQLVIVVVLDDRETVLERERGQARAPFRSHDHCCRKLMMRRNKNRTYRLACEHIFQCVDVEPMAIHRDRN